MKPEIEAKLTELITFADENGLMELSWAEGNCQISFRRGPALPKSSKNAEQPVEETPAVEEPQIKTETIKAPMVGTFRRAVGKDRPPLVLDGDHIKPGDRLGLVVSMKIPTDVISVMGGTIRKILVEDGQPVEYGQPLIEVEPETANV